MKWMYVVPREHDPKLVGTWIGNWSKFGDVPAKPLTFLADGTGRTEDRGSFFWGTKNGQVHVSYRSSGEGWIGGHADYSLSQDGKHVAFRHDGFVGVLPMSAER